MWQVCKGVWGGVGRWGRKLVTKMHNNVSRHEPSLSQSHCLTPKMSALPAYCPDVLPVFTNQPKPCSVLTPVQHCTKSPFLPAPVLSILVE